MKFWYLSVFRQQQKGFHTSSWFGKNKFNLFNPNSFSKKILSSKPLASEVLTCHLRQRGLPHGTSFFVYNHRVQNDQFGLSCFNWEVDGKNYQIFRTGCFPYIKYYCLSRAYTNLTAENRFYAFLKILNLGFPCLTYGVISWCFITYSEEVLMPDKAIVKVYFLRKEDPNALF